MKTVGVLGGMGPAATIDFFARVVRATPARTEQEHLHLIIDNNPGVPDRNRAVAGTGPSPGPALAQMAQRLEQAGADFLVMPCNTAHAFADHIRAATPLPFIDMIEQTVQVVTANPGINVGLLAADGCLLAGLYQTQLAKVGRTAVVPNVGQQQSFMRALYQIKTGEMRESRESIREVAEALVEQGVELMIAACTEVPLVLRAEDLTVPLVVSTDVLVARTIERAQRSDTL